MEEEDQKHVIHNCVESCAWHAPSCNVWVELTGRWIQWRRAGGGGEGASHLHCMLAVLLWSLPWAMLGHFHLYGLWVCIGDGSLSWCVSLYVCLCACVSVRVSLCFTMKQRLDVHGFSASIFLSIGCLKQCPVVHLSPSHKATQIFCCLLAGCLLNVPATC